MQEVGLVMNVARHGHASVRDHGEQGGPWQEGV